MIIVNFISLKNNLLNNTKGKIFWTLQKEEIIYNHHFEIEWGDN